MRSLSIAATGMLAQQLNVEVVSNNIANMNTTGFKRQRAEFQDLLYQNIERSGVSSSDQGTVLPNGIQVGVGVKAGAVYRVTEQGNLVNTENPYDLAIEGAGYFRVQLPDGTEGYTRAGSLGRSAEGLLVTQDGYPLVPNITIPQDAIAVSFSADGIVEATIAGQTSPQQLGQMELAIFFNPGGLQPLGNNLFTETTASGTAQTGTPAGNGFGSIQQAFLETSNVNAVSEITSLITAQRAYEMNARVITASDEMMSVTSNLN